MAHGDFDIAGSADALSFSMASQFNLADFLLEAAQEYPDKVCLETESGCWTFAQAARMAESVRLVLHRALKKGGQQSLDSSGSAGSADTAPPFHGRRPDEHVVCIVLDRGIECLAAVHATMMERCVYNTFDPSEPREKLRSWVEVASPPVMISSRSLMARLGLTEHGWSLGLYPKLVLDVHEALRPRKGREVRLPTPCKRISDLDRLCYVIFTSGSTGKPKAVMIQHQSACNLVRVWSDLVGLQASDRFAQMASMAFDNHVVEVYGAIHKRCTSVVCPDLVKRSGPDMLRWLVDWHVSGACVVPSLLRSMSGESVDVSAAALPHLQLLDCGGEALGQDIVEVWSPGRRLFNIYGPTEATVVCAGCEVKLGDEITIGDDLPTYGNYVLDPDTFEQLPAGCRGVLFTGGVGVGRGYLDDEEKTRAKFVQVGVLGRLYNTGDVASRDEQHRIHYHGRADWQVKVRGVRIELEALEQAVGNVPGVKHCEARVVADGTKLALIVSGEALSEGSLKEAAAKLGKGYQLNLVRVVENSAWKFNTSGKLVRNHVPLDCQGAAGPAGQVAEGQAGAEAPAGQRSSLESFEAEGASELELEVAACVAQLVWAESWGSTSHFIDDLGVDSAGFGKLITLLRRRPSLKCVDLPMLFEHPTVQGLARRIDERTREESEDGGCEDLEDWCGPSSYSEQDLVELFLASAKKWPHAVCCEELGTSTTYAQVQSQAIAIQLLLRRALRSARSTGLVAAAAQPVVVLLLDEGAELLAAQVAALLERCAICALDPALPMPELARRLLLVKPAVVLTDDRKASLLSFALQSSMLGAGSEATDDGTGLNLAPAQTTPPPALSTVIVDVAAAQKLLGKQHSIQRPRLPLPPPPVEGGVSGTISTPQLCLIIFTAGTAGQPQAALLGHAAVCWAVEKWCSQLGLGPADRHALLLPPWLSAGRLGQWSALAGGARILLPPPAEASPSLKPLRAKLLDWLASRRITVLGCRPSQLQSIEAEAPGAPEKLSTLRTVWVTGEPCAGVLAVRWAASGRRFLSLYSAAEALAALALDLLPAAAANMPSLREVSASTLPLAGHKCYILDDQLQPVEPGRQGYLFIGGATLAKGYTSSRTRGQLVEVPGLGLLFRPGDVVRETGSGLEFFVGKTALSYTFSSSEVTSGGRMGSSGRMSSSEVRKQLPFPVLLGSTEKSAEPWWARRMAIGTKAKWTRSSQQTSASSLSKYMLYLPGDLGDDQLWGVGSRPMLCLIVQSFVLLSTLLFSALQPILVFRVLLPLGMHMRYVALPVLVIFGLVAAGVIKVMLLITMKWLIIGKYKPGSYPIYGVEYLKHWIVDQMAKHTVIGRVEAGSGGWNFDLGINFNRNVVLRMLGADVALSAMITAPVTGFDLIHVGPLACVHGPHHLTPVSFSGKRMTMAPIEVGAGAFIGQNSCLAPASKVSAGAFVDPLSSVPRGAGLVFGHWSGVPARQVGPHDRSRVPAAGAGNCMAVAGGICSCFTWVLRLVPQILAPLLLVTVLKMLLSQYQMIKLTPQAAQQQKDNEQLSYLDGLPPAVFSHLYLAHAAAAGMAITNVLFQLLWTVLVCRLLPKVKAPLDLPMCSFMSFVASLKLQLASKTSMLLGDASVQAVFTWLIGAQVGKGASLSEQVMLPDTLQIGRDCFFASGNVLTSIVVDQGRMRIPTKTVIGNQVFLGNTNHISEGLPNGTFCGLHTWVPTKPTVPGENFFGNPAMKFGRPSSHGSEAPPSRRQVFWYHFSTSVVDIFFWDILKAQEWALAFMISTSCFKGSDSWPVLVFEVLIFAAMPVIFWFLMHIVFCNRIYNDRCPLSNDFYSGVVMRWFNANKIRRIFQSPFMAGGTMWQAPLMRLVGIHVGARFFATGEDVMIDPPFGRIGDDVTFDYDAQVRQHSFEDRKLKWGPNWVGSGTTILQGGCLAMSDAGEGVVLRHSSVTWKGQLLEPNQDYEGAPAVAVAEA